MQYSSIGKAPGSLLPNSTKKQLMTNPGKSRNSELAESFLFREGAMVRDLVSFFLKQPNASKATEYWQFFQEQWRNNIIHYIKNTNGKENVKDSEIDHYKNHYRFRTATRLAEEYVNRAQEMARVMERYPTADPRKSRSLFGMKMKMDAIHSRLIPLAKDLKLSLEDPESTMVER